MKKLTCTLLVAMFTMTAMLFAQTIGVPSVYFTVTNTRTQESQRIAVNDFTSEGSNNYSYDVDFCLGFNKGDKIEISYTERLAISTPQVAWTYSWMYSSSGDLGTASTANLSLENVPYDKSALTVTCGVLKGGTSKSYNINFKKVYGWNRIAVKQYSNNQIQIAYTYYVEDNVYSCSGKYPTTALFDIDGNPISTGGLNYMGVGTLVTNGYKGFGIVKVSVNNVEIFTETRQIN